MINNEISFEVIRTGPEPRALICNKNMIYGSTKVVSFGFKYYLAKMQVKDLQSEREVRADLRKAVEKELSEYLHGIGETDEQKAGGYNNAVKAFSSFYGDKAVLCWQHAKVRDSINEKTESVIQRDPADRNSGLLFSEEKFRAMYPAKKPESEEDDEDISSNKLEKRNSRRIAEIHDRLSGNPRFIEYTDEIIGKIEALFSLYPNFAPFRNQLFPEMRYLQLLNDRIIRNQNILLIGSPGCGKSSFVMRYADIIGHSERISLGCSNAAFSIVGSEKDYSSSDCGKILMSMFSPDNRPVANPLIILDEVDKADYKSSGTYTGLSGTFAEILEKNNAKQFRDHYFQVPVDASRINYIAIANDETKIPDYIASRFPVKIRIPDYTRQQLVDVVIPTVYDEWKLKHNFKQSACPECLSDAAKEYIADAAECSTRNIFSVLDEMSSAYMDEDSSRTSFSFAVNDSFHKKIMVANDKVIGFRM